MFGTPSPPSGFFRKRTLLVMCVFKFIHFLTSFMILLFSSFNIFLVMCTNMCWILDRVLSWIAWSFMQIGRGQLAIWSNLAKYTLHISSSCSCHSLAILNLCPNDPVDLIIWMIWSCKPTFKSPRVLSWYNFVTQLGNYPLRCEFNYIVTESHITQCWAASSHKMRVTIDIMDWKSSGGNNV